MEHKGTTTTTDDEKVESNSTGQSEDIKRDPVVKDEEVMDTNMATDEVEKGESDTAAVFPFVNNASGGVMGLRDSIWANDDEPEQVPASSRGRGNRGRRGSGRGAASVGRG